MQSDMNVITLSSISVNSTISKAQMELVANGLMRRDTLHSMAKALNIFATAFESFQKDADIFLGDD